MKHPVLLLARELHQGGSERQMTEIALGLDRARFEPHVGTFRPEGIRGDELRTAGVPVAHFSVYSFQSPAALAGAWQLARYIRRHIFSSCTVSTPRSPSLPCRWSGTSHPQSPFPASEDIEISLPSSVGSFDGPITWLMASS